MAVVDVSEGLIGTFDFVMDRTTARLVGLTDEELVWEPVAGCWSVREQPDGRWTIDGAGDAGEVDPAPVTTIAWRLTHLACHVLGGFATWLRDGGSPYGGSDEVPHTAARAREVLDVHWTRWRDGMAALDAEGWARPIGPQFGAHAESSTAGLVLHVLDEVVHHAAEVALLRDLYAARPLRDGAPARPGGAPAPGRLTRPG